MKLQKPVHHRYIRSLWPVGIPSLVMMMACSDGGKGPGMNGRYHHDHGCADGYSAGLPKALERGAVCDFSTPWDADIDPRMREDAERSTERDVVEYARAYLDCYQTIYDLFVPTFARYGFDQTKLDECEPFIEAAPMDCDPRTSGPSDPSASPSYGFGIGSHDGRSCYEPDIEASHRSGEQYEGRDWACSDAAYPYGWAVGWVECRDENQDWSDAPVEEASD